MLLYYKMAMVVYAFTFNPHHSQTAEEKRHQEIALVSAPEQQIAPCSERFANTRVELPLPSSSIGKDTKKAIKDPWSIEDWWGVKERTELVKGASDKSAAIRVHYPQGSINPKNKEAPRGGAGFYAKHGFDEKPITHACLQYKVFFPKEFEFQRGGKLPGLFGGDPASGCREDSELAGFSTRYMWRQNAVGTLYAYIPNKHKECGQLIGYGLWTFPRGQWVTLEQEVILNDVKKADGLIRFWVDGKMLIDRPSSILRVKPDVFIRGMMFSSFFGGKDPSWASPKDQYADFSEFSVYLPK